ncbi:hypothetical protein HanIR_Chr12g0608431 [Helianthus annuus]|nr:hypothetical protein HanIR_Chr12g0608431 [Helianthus annuus]
MLPHVAMRLAPHPMHSTSGTDTTVQVAPMAVTCQSYVSNGLTWRNLHNRQA